jgi:tetratricopeptide (TPR) repeat protein
MSFQNHLLLTIPEFVRMLPALVVEGAMFQTLTNRTTSAYTFLSKMNFLNEAIILNNMGAKLHQQGQWASCLSTFQRAVDTLRVMSEQVSEWRQLHAPSSSRFGTQQSSFCLETCRSRADSLVPGKYFVYNRSLLLSNVTKVSDLDELSAIILTASVSMIFNMAIAWHEFGQFTFSERYLAKAGELYDIVLSILDSTDNIPDDESFAVLKCLVLNNRAQLYYEQCNYVQSERCVDGMRHLLLSTDVLEAYLDVEEVDEMRVNVVYLQPPMVAPAA